MGFSGLVNVYAGLGGEGGGGSGCLKDKEFSNITVIPSRSPVHEQSWHCHICVGLYHRPWGICRAVSALSGHSAVGLFPLLKYLTTYFVLRHLFFY